MLRIRIFFIKTLLITCLFQTSFSQDLVSFDGQIIEEQSGESIPFVLLQVDGKGIGTVSKADGSFSLQVPSEYLNEKLFISCMGYESLVLSVSNLSKGQHNVIKLKVSVMDLGQVVVSRDKAKKPLKVLKEAIARIPENYPNKSITFDSYYREVVTENGGAVKFVDAAVTFQQGGYRGKKGRVESKFQFLESVGHNKDGIFSGKLEDFWKTILPGYRFHDHFYHAASEEDRVKIHASRRSINNAQKGVSASVERGPLSTLSKDLVRYPDLFMLRYKKYQYELFEEPSADGSWDYLIKFKPALKAESLETVRMKQRARKEYQRKDILSGTIRIDQRTMAIKAIEYRVEEDFRKLICGFEGSSLKHYGYEVKMSYRKVGDYWQPDHIIRKDEFIYQDAISQAITAYSATSEIKVIKPVSDIKSIDITESFVDVWCNTLYEYEQRYTPEFWKVYEKNHSFSKPEATLKSQMESTHRLEAQFSMVKQRTEEKRLRNRTVETEK